MEVEFTEDEFRRIGREYQRRTEDGDVDGKQIVQFHDDGDSMRPSESRTDRRDGRDEDSPSEVAGDASDDAEDDTEESDGSVERLRAWKEENEEYL